MELNTKLSGLLKATEEHFSATSSAKPTEETALAGDELIESRQSGMR
jgi:hypothetical protein